MCGLDPFSERLTTTELNIGTGNGNSNLEILQMIEKVMGIPVPYDDAPRREGDLTRLYADPKRAFDVIGFKARHSSLENIIATAWKFHKSKWDL